MLGGGVDGILRGFQRTIDKLDRLAKRNAAAIEFNDDVIRNVREESGKLEDERQKATLIRDRLQAIIAG